MPKSTPMPIDMLDVLHAAALGESGPAGFRASFHLEMPKGADAWLAMSSEEARALCDGER
ncbi:MAG: hypothetical protein AAF654_04375 [Myxococcota bacterium]